MTVRITEINCEQFTEICAFFNNPFIHLFIYSFIFLSIYLQFQNYLLSQLSFFFDIFLGILNKDEWAAEVRRARTRDRARTMEALELEANRGSAAEE